MAIDHVAGAADIVINQQMATLFLKLRLYRPLYRRLTRVGILDIPASHSQVLRSEIPVEVLDEAAQPGDGAIFAVEEFLDGLDMRVKADAAGNFSFSGNWAIILAGLNIRKNAVLSLWLFIGDGGVPTLVIRPDGYRKPLQRVPPLPQGLGRQPAGVNTPVFKGTANRFINFVTSTL